MSVSLQSPWITAALTIFLLPRISFSMNIFHVPMTFRDIPEASIMSNSSFSGNISAFIPFVTAVVVTEKVHPVSITASVSVLALAENFFFGESSSDNCSSDPSLQFLLDALVSGVLLHPVLALSVFLSSFHLGFCCPGLSSRSDGVEDLDVCRPPFWKDCFDKKP